MTDLPDIALSVRQPWAWAIFHADPVKDIENRSSVAIGKGSMAAGRRIAIQASRGMTRAYYEDAREVMRGIGVTCPPPATLLRGGIIGHVFVMDVVKKSDSPWFFGPRGLVLVDPVPCDFIPVSGVLGFFKWTLVEGGVPAPAARWMIGPDARVGIRRASEQAVLL